MEMEWKDQKRKGPEVFRRQARKGFLSNGCNVSVVCILGLNIIYDMTHFIDRSRINGNLRCKLVQFP
jgi:hypothetical protein